MSDIYLSLTETPAVVTLSQPVISGALSSTVTVANTVTVALDANSLSALENVTVTVGAAVSISNFPSTQTIAGTVTARTDLDAYGNSCVVVAFESPAGIQRVANVNGFPIRAMQDQFGTSIPLPISGTVTIGNSVTIGSLPAISGTVTVGNATTSSAVFVKICGELDGAGTNEPREILTDNSGMLYVRLAPSNARSSDPVIYDPVAGTAYINVRQTSSVTIGSLPAISGTVTANNPSGALTTRFGSVTTASMAQLTSCVTNNSRKYLLAQNISAGTVTIGIGFSPTTTQGIQLTAGAGLTFDSFCPTGAVYWLGAVTGAAFTILEG